MARCLPDGQGMPNAIIIPWADFVDGRFMINDGYFVGLNRL